MRTSIIFDADGVLIKPNERFSARLVRDNGADPTAVDEFFAGPFQECLVGRRDLKEAILPYLSALGWKSSVDDLLQDWFEAERELDENLLRYIERLRTEGLRVVCATNQEKYRAQYMLQQLGFSDVFEKVYASAHLGHKKPATEFFRHVVEDLDTSKENILFWDDDPANIAGARSYGIAAEQYSNYDSFVALMSKYGF